MIVTLIAAMAQDRVIGSEDGGIPWEMPRDRDHFRSYVDGKWLAVGRKTYEEMTDWFGDSVPIVVTSDPDYRPHSRAHRVATSATRAVDLARANGAREIVFIGGGELYERALPIATKLVLTRIDADIDGAVRFPKFEDNEDWIRVAADSWPADDENPHPMRVEIWERPGRE